MKSRERIGATAARGSLGDSHRRKASFVEALCDELSMRDVALRRRVNFRFAVNRSQCDEVSLRRDAQSAMIPEGGKERYAAPL
ncbi:MAG TPA: hypothetical protein VI072_05900 [Polyangiaceae bacterium]